MKVKIIIMVSLLCGLFFTSIGLSDAMVSRAGSGPECIKRINMWTEDSAGTPQAKLGSCPNHVYASLGGAFIFDYEIISWHADANYTVSMAYYNSKGQYVASLGTEYFFTGVAVTPRTDPPTYTYSRTSTSGISGTASFDNEYDCLEDNCGWIQVTATCSICGAPSEEFFFPVVFNPGIARTISVTASNLDNPDLDGLNVQAPITFDAEVTYNPGLWLSARTVTLIVDIGVGPAITVYQDQSGSGFYKKSRSVSDWGINDPLPEGVPVYVNGSVTDEFGTSADTVTFTILPDPEN